MKLHPAWWVNSVVFRLVPLAPVPLLGWQGSAGVHGNNPSPAWAPEEMRELFSAAELLGRRLGKGGDVGFPWQMRDSFSLSAPCGAWMLTQGGHRPGQTPG